MMAAPAGTVDADSRSQWTKRYHRATWVETVVPHASGDPLFLCGTVMHCRRTLAANYELGISVSRDAPSALS